MQDLDAQVRLLCASWWKTRNIFEDQARFQPGGEYHVAEGGFNATRCWLWQISQFLHTTFEYVDEHDAKQMFRPIDLDEDVQRRVVGQLGVDIGLFYRDFSKLYRQVLSSTTQTS